MILGFDTSGPHVAIALMFQGKVFTNVREMGRGQAEALLTNAEILLNEHAVNWTDLTALGVGVGPGNFTGIRISVSAARGLALGLGIPAIGVSGFATTARLAQTQRVTIPAPRDNVYFHDNSTDAPPVLTLPQAISGAVSSANFTPSQHITALVEIAEKQAHVSQPAPKPLYIKPADAAPPKDIPPELVDP